ncbi:MAG: type II toxin-antitoxin system RelE/ParE family toxin [Desulfobacterales bacterium]
MPVFRLSAKSLEDLKSIGRFTLKSWGREQRNIYLSKLDESFHILAEQPYLGNARDDIRKGYRVYHVGRHLIFYRQKSIAIEIIRILHDRMDVKTHLRKG